ncbi:MAG: alpha/beta fold hydrolase, partial [Thermoflexia bacterium]
MPYVRVNGVRLHYLAQGFGPAVLLLHGLGSCGEDWLLLQAPALSQRHRVLMPDLRGHGRSDVPPGPYTVPQMADDIAGFLEATGTDSAHMVGLSLGGAVAQALAVRHPTRVRSLVLVNTFAHLRPKGWAEWRQTLTRVLAPLLDHTKYARLEAEELFPHPGQRGLQRVAFQRLCSTHPMGFRAALPAAARYDGRWDLSRIQAPTLVVAGLDDTVVPLRAKEELVARIPGARLVP